MKFIVYSFIFLLGAWGLISFQGCAPTAEEQDLYGAVTEEIAPVDTAEIRTLSEENTALKEQVEQLKKDRVELEKKIQSLQDMNNQLTAKISELGSQLETEKQRTRELSTKLSEAEAKIAGFESMPKPGATEEELQLEIAKRDSEIAQYKQTVRDLQAKLAELETKLAETPKPTAPTVGAEIKPAKPVFIPETPSIKLTEAETKKYYQTALNNFNKRKYKEAIARLDSLVNSTADAKLKLNAIYWLGESYFALKQYDKAIEYFNYVVEAKGAKTPDALYMLGRCYAALGKIKEAKEYMNRVLKEYPKSPVAKKARDRLQRL